MAYRIFCIVFIIVCEEKIYIIIYLIANHLYFFLVVKASLDIKVSEPKNTYLNTLNRDAIIVIQLNKNSDFAICR